MDITFLLVSSACSAGVGIIVSQIFSCFYHKYEGSAKYTRATQEAVKLMLMDKTKHLTHKAVKCGEITLAQRALILQMVDTAHELGANGEMTQCANEVNSLPTVHELK